MELKTSLFWGHIECHHFGLYKPKVFGYVFWVLLKRNWTLALLHYMRKSPKARFYFSKLWKFSRKWGKQQNLGKKWGKKFFREKFITFSLINIFLRDENMIYNNIWRIFCGRMLYPFWVLLYPFDIKKG